MKIAYILCRYFVAFFILFYGFAKLNGAQFTILESELDKPMREVSGFWLTWYYFGYSAIYGTFIALVQIAAGILLMFRKTTLLGACMLFGLVTNIILIDIFYRIDLSALFMAILLEAALIAILWQHKDDLLDLFWRRQNSIYPVPQHDKNRLIKYGVRLLVIVLPAIFTYYIANYNNRRPTPLDGRWEVTMVTDRAGTTRFPDWIYFERNRAFMAVFRYPDTLETHHFVVTPDDSLMIWEHWLRKGEMLFAGRYVQEQDTLALEGTFKDAPLRATLVRRD